MTESAKQKIVEAAVVADWMQVVLNQGQPCFHLEEYGSFCLRSERWDGHGIEDFHDFVSLHDLLRTLIIPENDTPTPPASSPEATQQAAEQASAGQVAQRVVMSTEQMVARIAELEPLERFMQAWGEKHPRELKDEDFIADVKRDIAKCTKDRSEFSEPPVDCDHCHSFARLLQMVAETREIAGELIDYACHQEHCSIGGTPHCICALDTLLARAKAAGIAPSPDEIRPEPKSREIELE